ncbi:MAG: tRNA (guanosine(37)-N1)-methyltransferase TrmD [Calditrichaeota bacterium]|nr:tRNA (guanosine(37)-N1)-methyltransferase TrmD [Calditrichota bacterium]
MRINIVTGFPDFFEGPLTTSIMAKAIQKKKVTISLFDLKDYTISKHKTIDDQPFAGKPGMILKPEPFFRVMEEINIRFGKHPVVYFGPEGKQFNQEMAKEMQQWECMTFLCGHFKGIDFRVIEKFVTEFISIGDFIVTGGEIAAAVVTDAIVRLIPGVLNDLNSATTDSFEDGLLDCDYYTRPENYQDMRVPDVLLSGHHKQIENWKFEEKIKKTKKFRPDLYQTYMNRKGR